MSISPQPTMPASVEILTKTQEFFRTKVSILVTLTLSFGPIGRSGGAFGREYAIKSEQGGGAEKSSKQGATIYL